MAILRFWVALTPAVLVLLLGRCVEEPPVLRSACSGATVKTRSAHQASLMIIFLLRCGGPRMATQQLYAMLVRNCVRHLLKPHVSDKISVMPSEWPRKAVARPICAANVTGKSQRE
jgi:hypothetical protein